MKKKEINQNHTGQPGRSNTTSEKTTNMLLIFMNVKIKNWCSPFLDTPADVHFLLCFALFFVCRRKKDGTAKNVIIISLMCVVIVCCLVFFVHNNPLKRRRDNHGQRWIKHLIYLWPTKTIFMVFLQTETHTHHISRHFGQQTGGLSVLSFAYPCFVTFYLDFSSLFQRNTKNTRNKRCKMLLCGVS